MKLMRYYIPTMLGASEALENIDDVDDNDSLPEDMLIVDFISGGYAPKS
jgi:hypothetical protein